MSSFPASKYSRYKRATAFFLDWLLRARGRGRYASKRLDLDAFSAVVSDIAQDPSILTPKLLQDLPKALGACQCAITLREHVAVFFDDKEQGHLHFLSRLRNWLDKLKQIQVRQVPIQEEIRKFANYYQVLQVDEDYFPDDERFVKDKGVTNKSKAERKRLFDEAFAQDLQLEVVCYFMELEELMEGVFDIYQQVKKQEKTMMEATVVGTLALRIANQLTATLQLRYPALKSAEELVGVLLCYPSTSLGTQMAKAVEERRAKFDKEGTMSFVPWTLLHDFTNIWATLSMLVPIFPPIEPIEAAQLVALPDGYFGVNYGEERTPEYVFADPNHCVVLLAQQMPMLYNSIAHKRVAMGPGYKGQSGLVVDFMSAMETYFENRQVTIQLVFLCLCWMQSVTALQGDGGLSRNICLSINHTENLIRILNTSLPKHSPRVNRDSFHALMKDIMHGYEASLRTNNLAPANPLFAGSQMMSNHLEYLIIGNGHFVSLCGAFCHLYNALVQEGFLGPIPFFDEMLVVYEEMIFNPSSRAKAVHGSYNRIYLLSSRYSGASIDSTYDSASAVRKRATKWRDPDPNQHSLTYRFMHDDMSFLKGASSKTMLKNAADVCSKELFETRILSRDLLTLNDDLIDVFSELCHALGRDVVFDEYMAGGWDAPTPQEVKLSRSLEHAVMLPLMALLDALQPDGSVDSSAVPAEIQMTVECLVDGELIRQMCSSVAAVIKARFGNSQICEQRYFTFPSTPDLVNREYGSMSFKLKTKDGKREQIFSDLMKLMKSRSGPLTGSDLSYLKSEIKKDPELLGMFSRRNPESIDHTKCDDLCTLLHQAAAGTAHDVKLVECTVHAADALSKRTTTTRPRLPPELIAQYRDVKLVEWLIQMGALFTQPMHCRKEPRQRDLACPRNLLPNTMAIHSAVIVGHHAIVKVLLEADNLVDINTLTYHTKETIAHLAVKNGHKTLYYGIQGYGADVRILDGKGRRVCELTTDRKWSREIAQIAARIELSCSLGRGRCEPPGLFEGALTRLAAHTRKSVFSQRDDERQRALDVLTANSPVKSKKKKTAKKGVKGKRGHWSNFTTDHRHQFCSY
ncbi:hypothetical protein PHMEG_00028770 [Phytophthora megakarya]|uniref:DUF6604 domain-containing protein n=1 Tax=Phytophthora megakarya TaxID=4795 RepID=A0A225V490_9STRA|nr:hypothetical protein PHMEG_00028770 [Phytophthora megakarya]